jgi:hypothetical protein
MTQILALQQLDIEPEDSAAPCFSISGSSITIHTE